MIVDLSIGQQFRVEHDDWVRAAAFSRDGRLLATAGNDRTLRLWNTESGEEISRLELEGVVDGLIFSPDDQLLASSIRLSRYEFVRGEINVWEPATGERLQRFGDHPGFYTDIVYSADGRLLATSSTDRTAMVWDAQSGHEQARLEHRGPVLSLAFTPDVTRLTTRSAWETRLSGNEQAQVWDWAKRLTIGTLTELGGVHSMGMRVTEDRKRVATEGIDDTLRLWDAETGRELYRFPGMRGVSLNADGEYLAMKEEASTTIHVRRLASDSVIARLPYAGKLHHFVLGPKAKFLAAVITDASEEIWPWDVASEALIVRLAPPIDIREGWNPNYAGPRKVFSLAFSPDGALLAAAGWSMRRIFMM